MTTVEDTRIYLADLAYTQQSLSSDSMPSAIGGIAVFAEDALGLSHGVRLFKYPEKLIEALESGEPPRIVGFSNYVWNSGLGYAFAEIIRKKLPGTVIVCGGPNYPILRDEQEAFLRARPAIDFYVWHEGEQAFADLVTALVEADFDVEAVKRRHMPSVHAIADDGTAMFGDEAGRLRDLSMLPSPYLAGKMDEFLDGRLMPILQTNRGCPFSCTYCVEGEGHYNKVRHKETSRIAEEVEYMATRMAELREEGGRQDLFIADSNFGMFKQDLETCRIIGEMQDKYQWPEYISVATGKNQKERVLEAAKLVKGALRLAGSVQSLDEGVLKNIRRDNISFEQMIDLALKATDLGANSYSEVILALPGDTLPAHFDTIRQLMDAGFPSISLHTLMLLNGSDMATPDSKERFGMDVRYRVLPQGFGHYRLLGEDLVAAEIEQVCVGNNTLSFEDYVACRRLHLVIHIFYNDSVFATLLKILRHLGIPLFNWVETLHRLTPPEGLADVFRSFEEATSDELWPDRQALADRVAEPGTVERYLKGELGYNLIFVHKALALTRHGDDLATLAGAAMREVLTKHKQDTPEVLAFLDDALDYHRMRIANLFDEIDTAPEGLFTYDIAAVMDDSEISSFGRYLLPQPTAMRFELDERQKDNIRTYVELFGKTPIGIGRILSKFHFRRLCRAPVLVGPAEPQAS